MTVLMDVLVVVVMVDISIDRPRHHDLMNGNLLLVFLVVFSVIVIEPVVLTV